MVGFTRCERKFVMFWAAVSFMLLYATQTQAMHIMEGYLPAAQSILWGAVCLPFLALSYIKIKHTVQNHRKTLLLLAMSGAFIFVISSLKIPSVTGSCSHMTGTGLAAILFGPFHAGILGLIVLLFQAILLAHGGITTLGANTFSMAIAGPIFTWLLYQSGQKLKLNRKVNLFIAAMLGDLFTYCVTAMQLAVAYPSENGGVWASAVKFLAVFAPTQFPLAVVEGILTVVILIGMETYAEPELHEIKFLGNEVR